MHIKQLEISGFKSFVDRTVIQFDHDIIGIVGPNGCGKSNIVDAIRWCMGEQSAKHLRGKAMADVIFSGSATRGPHGLAEVTLTFDNSDPESARSLPIEYRDYPELAITRRLYRNGNSEYLINKVQVRLRDITDIFLGTGVGTKAYSIVEQGRIGRIVSARAEDRRSFIEEAAGITKYKHRRKQAAQKMNHTRQNLERVGDIIGEIDRNLASLRRQAAKAERYKAYRAELEDLSLHEASHRFLELEVRSQVSFAAMGKAGEASQQARTELAARESELEALRQKFFSLEEATEEAQTKSYGAKNAAQGLEGELTRLGDRLRSLVERANHWQREEEDLDQQLEQLTYEQSQLKERLASLGEGEEAEVDLAEHAQERLEELQESEQAALGEVQRLQQADALARSQMAGCEAKLNELERRVRELQGRREKLSLRGYELSAEKQELDGERMALSAEVGDLALQRDEAREELAGCEKELQSCRVEQVELQKRLDDVKHTATTKRSRLSALSELARRMDGVGKGSKALLATKDPAIVGLVADAIDAPAGLSQALAAALGDRLQDVVVADQASALRLLETLAAQGCGRAGVVWRVGPGGEQGGEQGSEPRSSQRDWELIREKGGQPLLDQVAIRPEDAGWASALLGKVIVAESASAALTLGACFPELLVVTSEGLCVESGARMVGGRGDSVGSGMLDQKREIRALEEETTQLEAALEEANTNLQESRRKTSELSTRLEGLRRRSHETDLAHLRSEKDLRSTEERLLKLQESDGGLEQELADIDDALAAAADERADASLQQEEADEVLDGSQAKLEAALGLAAEWRERVAAQLSLVTEQKVRLARVKEQVQGLEGAIGRIQRSLDEAQKRKERLDHERVETAEEIGQTAGKIFCGREDLVQTVADAREKEARLVEVRGKFEAERVTLSEREQALKGLRQQVEHESKSLTAHELELQKLTLELKHLLDGVAEKFGGLDLRTVVGDYHKRPLADESLRTRIRELDQLLSRMGPVNLDAVREHAEAQKRFDFYDGQRQDLEAALADLQAAIDQMDRESKRLFKATFDSVNTKFQALFPRLFRGGNAELRLSNPEALLETGVEILAQPPGKKLGNIELMSGGEKALTAVSLIFAMFQHKPSPFCILDEVDAPLDEANVARYNEAIRSMTDQSQFIMITHIKRTMQSVDVLYGVTMQEAGVSKLVGVQVNDQAAGRAAGQKSKRVAADGEHVTGAAG